MNLTPISFNVTHSNYKSGQFKKMNYVSTPNSNNNIDTFELKASKISKQNISFKSAESGFANLHKYEGIRKMMDHFSILKSRDPGSTKKIETIKDFIVELNDMAKSKGQEIYLVWDKKNYSKDLSLNNMDYSFQSGYETWFYKDKYAVFGSGEELHELVEETNLIDQGKSSNDAKRYFCELFHKKYGTSEDFSIKGCLKERILGDLRTPSHTKATVGYGFRSIDSDTDMLTRVNNILSNIFFENPFKV